MSTLREATLALAAKHPDLKPHLLEVLATTGIQWKPNTDGGWLGSIGNETVARLKQFRTGWFRSTRNPGGMWSGWEGPFKNDEQAKNLRLATEKVAAPPGEIGLTILDQMGGKRRLALMLGIKTPFYDVGGGKGVGFMWPNRERSKGNTVEIELLPDDTYEVRFFNLAATTKKLVKSFQGIYAEDLVGLFERQTGWYLRLGSKEAGSSYAVAKPVWFSFVGNAKPFNRDTIFAINQTFVPYSGDDGEGDAPIHFLQYESSGPLSYNQEKAGMTREYVFSVSFPEGSEKAVEKAIAMLGKRDKFKVTRLPGYRKPATVGGGAAARPR